MGALARIGVAIGLGAAAWPAYHLLMGMSAEQSSIASLAASLGCAAAFSIPSPKKAEPPKPVQTRKISTALEVATAAAAACDRIRAAAASDPEACWALCALRIAESAQEGVDRIREDGRIDAPSRKIATQSLELAAGLTEALARPDSASPEAMAKATEALEKLEPNFRRFAYGKAATPDQAMTARAQDALQSLRAGSESDGGRDAA